MYGDMSITHSPKIVTNGLVLYYDMANTKKSWKGAPTTNLFKQSGSTDLSSSSDIYAVSTKTSLGNGKYRWKNTSAVTGSTVRVYCDLSYLTSGQSYGLGLGYENLFGGLRLDWCDTTPTGIYSTTNISGRLSAVGTRSVYDSTYRFLDINLEPLTVVDLFEEQLDSLAFATPYTASVRSNAQNIIDLTGNNILTANSLTYASDNTFSFNGAVSGSYITVPFNSSQFTFNNEQTIIIWMMNQSPSTTRRNPYNQAYAGGGTITHENDTNFNYYYGTGGADNSPYTSFTSGVLRSSG